MQCVCVCVCVCVYTGWNTSQPQKKNEITASAATWMDLHYHTKGSQTKTILYSICMWNLNKNDTNELIYNAEIDSQTQRENLWSPKGKGEEE